MMGFWDAVALTGPYANNLHLASITAKSSLTFTDNDIKTEQLLTAT